MKPIDLTLTISCEWNAAFGADEDEARAELGRILHAAAERIEGFGEDFRLYDVNGNRVGRCELELEVPEEEEEEEEE